MKQICNTCPRRCGADRANGVGYCGMTEEIRIARAALHPWEEPCISGKNGSGTVFFCGCSLRCVFCQNREISSGENNGRAVTPDELINLMLKLQSEGAENINLVTPTHYAQALIPVLRKVRPLLHIPVVYNCGGYEAVETLKGLAGLVDIYLPDAKYFSSELSARYSGAPDYYTVMLTALCEMLSQVGKPRFDASGNMIGGVLLRHLVLPGCRRDSILLLRALAAELGTDAFLLSLMSQYTPDFVSPDADKALHRRLTTFEYDAVCDEVQKLGFEGYTQALSAASAAYTPSFREPLF